MRYPKGLKAYRTREQPPEYRPREFCDCAVDVGVGDVERAKLALHSLSCVCVLSETPLMRLVQDPDTGRRKEVHTGSQLSVLGKGETDREFQSACLSALRMAGIEAWLQPSERKRYGRTRS